MTATRQSSDVGRRHGWRSWLRLFFVSDVGLKWLMALSGIYLLGFVLAHMLGNLHTFQGINATTGDFHVNEYGEALRDLGEPIAPRSLLLWIIRLGLILALAVHISSALILTLRNRKARGATRYEHRREYLAANYASRTMLWGGIIVFLFLVYHLADLTWGAANPDFIRGDVYGNMIASFNRWPVTLLYLVAQVALAFHIYHGAWSMFQSLGAANPRYNDWRRGFAVVFAAVIFVGYVSVPISIQLGIVS